MKIPELTTLCYLERDGKYLMLHRVKKEADINRDKYIGVGGHFAYGESPDECLRREVLEETGLTLRAYRARGIVTFVYGDDVVEFRRLRQQHARQHDVGKTQIPHDGQSRLRHP